MNNAVVANVQQTPFSWKKDVYEAAVVCWQRQDHRDGSSDSVYSDCRLYEPSNLQKWQRWHHARVATCRNVVHTLMII